VAAAVITDKDAVADTPVWSIEDSPAAALIQFRSASIGELTNPAWSDPF
jgi:hypothetical protein